MVISSIDLMDGKAVQLVQGERKVLEREDPLLLAAEFSKLTEIAVIDLDAAMGKPGNTSVVRSICALGNCRVGGGIHTVDQAVKFVSYGAHKVIVGTKVFGNNGINIDFLKDLCRAIGKQRVVVAVDSRCGEVVTNAWKENTGIDLFDAARMVEPYAAGFLYTCVEKEGKMAGTDIGKIRRLRNTVNCSITAAGGIHQLETIDELARIGVDAQLGMALYTGKLNLNDCLISSVNWDKGLLPVITRDNHGQVLMLAYMNRESLTRTLASGYMWYFSRSKNRLWQKGETSGSVQQLIKLRLDCDRDTLLATVEQTGCACHLDNYSCFGPKDFSLSELQQLIRERFNTSPSGSYTATLTERKVREKLVEEAGELIMAQSRDEVIWEAADVLYFLSVLINRQGLGLDDVIRELQRRRWKLTEEEK